MDAKTIIENRFRNQKLIQTAWSDSPERIVFHFGAMQAQNYGQSLWAVGSRMTTPSEQAVEQAINNGEIIRTWLLRGTIHLFSAKDYHWMMDLIAPSIDKICKPYRAKLGLTEEVLHKATEVVSEIVSEQAVTRKDLAAHLATKDLPSTGIPFAQLLVYLSSRKVICSGPNETFRNTMHIPADTNHFTREEAIKELAKRYIQSHAPATLKDFCFWSGLTVTDAKIGLADMPKMGDYYITTLVENGTMPTTIPLAGFDEWIIGYRDRSAVLPEIWHDEIMTKNGIFRPAIITEGKVVGKWEKPKKRDELDGDFWDRYIQFRNML
ncbi:TPA: winged helix DNA-binding domain-containing protein [Listeria monocytogenes]|uniref:winged helix DNA-binding domain-containing protein n=1 Tax=Listeria monocytogenes TaxID=1639 RepID=UPI0010E8B74B|nr:winged helix DNA-binding domain-containing protein [Listeria monocytogenes]EAE1293105.1 winged helix DNA-binding domain-containing protein [Listeria monocytogenes]HAO6018496.1 winged helix DNA-binding domain-containing protein [Listeria monocytogenes]HAO6019341.1 winged helix DNA-binding domain-containing protein [Listeria monocytogenes]HAO6737136.1 winged helix DNA-binding domain-containing protein [Listeria monocytogenes]